MSGTLTLNGAPNDNTFYTLTDANHVGTLTASLGDAGGGSALSYTDKGGSYALGNITADLVTLNETATSATISQAANTNLQVTHNLKVTGGTGTDFVLTAANGNIVGAIEATLGVGGGDVSFTGNGGYGLDNITASTLVNAAGTITPAPLTITANNATQVLGTPEPVFSASFGAFPGGLGPSALDGMLSFTTNAPTGSPGSFRIFAGGVSSTNFDISFVPGTLLVTAANNSLPPVPFSMDQGNGTPAFSFTDPGAPRASSSRCRIQAPKMAMRAPPR